MPDGSVTPAATDRLVVSVQAQVTGLARGNPFPEETFSFESSRQDRSIVLTMRVDVTSKETPQTLQGQQNPTGSTRVQNAEAILEFLIAAFDRTAYASDTLGRITAKLKAGPAQAFVEIKDGFDIGVVAARCHAHEPCGRCGQTGVVDCDVCHGRGRVNCYVCTDGKQQCSRCSHGSVYYTEKVWSPASQAYTDEGRSRRCDTCSGSGRAGTCSACNGLRNIPCRGCGERGTVGCGTCGRTGWLTVATTLNLVGKPVRAVSFLPDTPPEFCKSIAGLPVTDLPVLHGKVVRSLVEEADGKAVLGLECVVPHVTLEARFAPDCRQRFDAVGLQGRISVMPVFLDRMLRPLSNKVNQAADDRRFEELLRLTKQTPLTRTVLIAASGRERHGLDELRSLWKGAASDTLLNGFLGNVAKAYDGVGAAAVSGPWKLLALPVIAIAAAAFPLHIARPILAMLSAQRPPDLGTEMLLSACLGTVPFGLTFAFAARRARKAVREIVGLKAARIPSQGWWARGVGIAVLVALVAGASASGDPAFLPVTASAMQATPAAAQQVVQGPVRMRLLAPSPLPRLQPVLSAGKTRGKPDVYRLQFLLWQLGFLHLAPDGIVHASTYDALETFNDSLPPTRKRVRFGRDATPTVEAALRGDFALQRLPIDHFPVPSLSNLARANLTGIDTEFMKQAASEALASPGQEVRWRSADGAHGGRLMATRLPTGCPLLQVEVEIRGAIEAAGPFPFCRDQRR